MKSTGRMRVASPPVWLGWTALHRWDEKWLAGLTARAEGGLSRGP